MQFSIATIVAATAFFISSTSASPLDKRACTVSANVVETWQEDALTRRRVAYSTTKGGVDMAALGGDFIKDHIEKCSAINNNIGIYHHDGLNSWVVDDNQVLGVAGDNAHDCLMRMFRDSMSADLGCSIA